MPFLTRFSSLVNKYPAQGVYYLPRAFLLAVPMVPYTFFILARRRVTQDSKAARQSFSMGPNIEADPVIETDIEPGSPGFVPPALACPKTRTAPLLQSTLAKKQIYARSPSCSLLLHVFTLVSGLMFPLGMSHHVVVRIAKLANHPRSLLRR